MTDAHLLSRIKKGLGITGNYQDETLQVYIDDVKEYMLSAGVKSSIIESSSAIGCILRGVADLWNLGNGSAQLSPYFKQRVIQLSLKQEAEQNVQTD